MKTIKKILFYLSFGLSFMLLRGQSIGNYANNGSFEEQYDCNSNALLACKHWTGIDTFSCGGAYCRKCFGQMPLTGWGYQFAQHGDGFVATTFYLAGSARCYLKNRLKQPLQQGQTYCVKFYVSICDVSTYGMDGFGAYFGDSSIDTIQLKTVPLTYLNPQIKNPIGNVITDTMRWTLITGTFVANGNEKYALLGNFLAENALTTTSISAVNFPYIFTDAFVDAFSCIPFDLPAYAGSDKSIVPGDSVFIGREPDYVIDTGCVWYKLPDMTTSIDTISGLWVKPTLTSTYVVRQQLDCSSLKWDTVVVSMNLVGLDKLQNLSNKINLFPNPTSGDLSISGFSASDISSFSISNCLGQNVLYGDIIQKNNLINVETSELESGLYQIHLKTQYGIVTKKFVKTN